jgi:hypothetical protein
VSRRRPIGDRLADAAARLRPKSEPIILHTVADPAAAAELTAALDKAVRVAAEQVSKSWGEYPLGGARFDAPWTWGAPNLFTSPRDFHPSDADAVDTTARVIGPALPPGRDDDGETA